MRLLLAGNVAGVKKLTIQIYLSGKPGEIGPLDRSLHQWEYNIRTSLKEIKFEDENQIHMVLIKKE